MMIAAVAVSTGFVAEAVASAERRQEEPGPTPSLKWRSR